MAARHVGDTYGGYRARLVEELRQHGIHDLAVLRAVGETPRHLFVPEALRHRAYEDAALPIGHGQTISQPSTQALALQALELQGRERVLEIGTGSGYQAALLSTLVETVTSVERLPRLVEAARSALMLAGIDTVTVILGDGTLGWRPGAPYDAILVAAAGPSVPEPLVSQLAEGGQLVVPVEERGTQQMMRYAKRANRLDAEPLGSVRFVRLIGRHGFNEETT
jgi:protein-L-isoaspartate(D-aspartate) O-methyltransferase